MPGRHNVLNAAAAVAVGRELGVEIPRIREALAGFEGVGRRFDVVRTRAGITLVDDYGHHPTEVRAVLETARGVWDGRIICVFQPHRYSRTQALWELFGPSFATADRLWVLPVYAAGEPPIAGVDSRLIYRAAREAGHNGASLIDEPVERVAGRLRPELTSGDVVITLGAGDVWKIHQALVQELGGEEDGSSE
jgi:UDP-N-acetylmuramate--alanine ligase